MKAKINIVNPDEVEIKIEMTMKLSEWKAALGGFEEGKYHYYADMVKKVIKAALEKAAREYELTRYMEG